LDLSLSSFELTGGSSLSHDVSVSVLEFLLGLSSNIVEKESPDRSEGDDEPDNGVSLDELAVEGREGGGSPEGSEEIVPGEDLSGLSSALGEEIASSDVVSLSDFLRRDISENLSVPQEIDILEGRVNGGVLQEWRFEIVPEASLGSHKLKFEVIEILSGGIVPLVSKGLPGRKR